jgi:hypothetical protein
MEDAQGWRRRYHAARAAGDVTPDTPDDWIPPAPCGEPLVDYLHRSITNHPRIVRLRADCARYQKEPVSIPSRLFPSDYTVEKWRKKWPERSFGVMAGAGDAEAYCYERALEELLAVTFDKLRPYGKLVVHAYHADDPKMAKPVPSGLWDLPKMQFDLQKAPGDRFGPKSETVASSPEYSRLIVYPTPDFVPHSWHERRRNYVKASAMADWCGREKNNITPVETKVVDARRQLLESIENKEFDVDGKTRAFFFNKASAWWVTPENLEIIRKVYGVDVLIDKYMSDVWLLRSLLDIWCKRKKIEPPPHLFPPAPPASVQSSPDGLLPAAPATAVHSGDTVLALPAENAAPAARKRSSGLDYRQSDDLLARAIIVAVDWGHYKNDWNGALALADCAEGNAIPESKAKRLNARVKLIRHSGCSELSSLSRTEQR